MRAECARFSGDAGKEDAAGKVEGREKQWVQGGRGMWN